MNKRYIYQEVQKPGKVSTGYGKVIDTQPTVSWDNEIATIFNKKTAIKVAEALNLNNDLSKLKRSATKAEITEVLNNYNIKVK